MRIAQKDLLESLQNAMRAHNKGAALPILHGIFMHAENGVLELSCTDLDYWARCTTACEGDLSVVAQASVLLEIAKRIKGDVELTCEADRLVIRTDKTRYELYTMAKDEFPLFPVSDEQTFLIPSDDLRRLASVAYAAENEKGPHPHLQGVLITSFEDGIRAVATDTFRMAIAEATSNVGFDLKVIVPPRILRDVSKLVGMIECGVTSQLVRMSCGNVTYVTRLVGGQFPAYQKLPRDEHEARVVIETKVLREALDRVAALRRDKADIIRLQLDGDLVISTTNVDVGRAEDSVPANIEGATQPVHLRRVYLADAINAVDTSELTVLFPGGGRPVNIIAGNMRHLIMPVTVNESF